MGIKAIETVYNGYRFRSRLEARWAVFFDALGVAYEYEKEGFDLDGLWYLPDFWLPQYEAWYEVKPSPDPPQSHSRIATLAALSEGADKARALALLGGRDVYVCIGEPWLPLLFLGSAPQTRGDECPEDSWSEGKYRVVVFDGGSGSYDNDGKAWQECTQCGHIALGEISGFTHRERDDCGHGVEERDTPRLRRAYEAARQARFEFGETRR